MGWGGGCGLLSLGISMEEKVGMADALGWPSCPFPESRWWVVSVWLYVSRRPRQQHG